MEIYIYIYIEFSRIFILLHTFIFHTMEVNGAHQLFGYPYSSKYLLLCLAEQKKEIHTGLEHLEGEQMMTEFSFLGELSF